MAAAHLPPANRPLYGRRGSIPGLTMTYRNRINLVTGDPPAAVPTQPTDDANAPLPRVTTTPTHTPSSTSRPSFGLHDHRECNNSYTGCRLCAIGVPVKNIFQKKKKMNFYVNDNFL